MAHLTGGRNTRRWDPGPVPGKQRGLTLTCKPRTVFLIQINMGENIDCLKNLQSVRFTRLVCGYVISARSRIPVTATNKSPNKPSIRRWLTVCPHSPPPALHPGPDRLSTRRSAFSRSVSVEHEVWNCGRPSYSLSRPCRGRARIALHNMGRPPC